MGEWRCGATIVDLDIRWRIVVLGKEIIIPHPMPGIKQQIVTRPAHRPIVYTSVLY
jgi:hypothetical protein